VTGRRLAAFLPAALTAGLFLFVASPARALDQEAFANSFAVAMRDAMLAMAQRMAKGPECLLSRFGEPQADPLLTRRRAPGRSLPEGELDYVPLGHSSLPAQDEALPAPSQCQMAR
jgi:hypothetical protein